MATLVHSHGGPGASHPAQWQFLLVLENHTCSATSIQRQLYGAGTTIWRWQSLATTHDQFRHLLRALLSRQQSRGRRVYFLPAIQLSSIESAGAFLCFYSAFRVAYSCTGRFIWQKTSTRAGPERSNGSYYQNTRRDTVNFSYCKKLLLAPQDTHLCSSV